MKTSFPQWLSDRRPITPLTLWALALLLVGLSAAGTTATAMDWSSASNLLSPQKAYGLCEWELQQCILDVRAEHSVCADKCELEFDACFDGCQSAPNSPGVIICAYKCGQKGYQCLKNCGKAARIGLKKCKWDYAECDDPCGDGTNIWCKALPPTCAPGTILTVQNHCWACVDPDTCGEPCDDEHTWNPKLEACCPDISYYDYCYCPTGQSSSIPQYDDNGCLLGYGCKCEPGPCDDGTQLSCKALPPDCPDNTILAIQNGCWACVDPQTCAPPCDQFEEWDPELEACCPTVYFIADCFCENPNDYVGFPVYNEDGCLIGQGCACINHECSDGTELLCDSTPPQCASNEVLTVRESCWACVPIDKCYGCSDDEHWDEDLMACCPDNIFIADCFCPNGQAITVEVHDDNGCLLGYGCKCKPGPCDDGTQVVCAAIPPVCPANTILAVQNGCWVCVDPQTCAPPCDQFEEWDPELEACCPTVYFIADCFCENPNDYVGFPVYNEDGCLIGQSCTCINHECSDGTELLCDSTPPQCASNEVLTIRESCWACVPIDKCYGCSDGEHWDEDLMACCPDSIFIADCYCPTGEVVSFEVHDDNGCLLGYGCECKPGPCDDGTQVLCDALPPDCPDNTILAVQNGCWACVDPQTCAPPCDPFEQWDPDLGQCCPTSIYIADCYCPGQSVYSYIDYAPDGCIEGYACTCVDPGCGDGSKLQCDAEPPYCPKGSHLAIVNGCWDCQPLEECDLPCSDGSQVLCDALPPQCPFGQAVSVQNGCWVCVNPDTCEKDCTEGEEWDPELQACCPTAIYIEDCYCPNGQVVTFEVHDDNGCLLGYGCKCKPEPCSDNQPVICAAIPPVCPAGTIIAAQNGCWQCVDPDTCAPPCKNGQAWDPEVLACCPKAQFVADCWCQEGYKLVTYPVFNSQGCKLGQGCTCVEKLCSDNTQLTCDAPPPQCGQGQILSVHNGCWQCVTANACQPVCDDFETWDSELQTCCPNTFFTPMCLCPNPNSQAVLVPKYNEEGCHIGDMCSCCPAGCGATSAGQCACP